MVFPPNCAAVYPELSRRTLRVSQLERPEQRSGVEEAFGLPPVVLAGPTQEIAYLSFDPSGRLLFSGSHDNKLFRWDPATGVTRSEGESTGRILSGVFGPGGQSLITGLPGGTLMSWRVEGEPQTVLWKHASGTANRHTQAILSLALTPEGRLLSASLDGTVRQWEPANGEFQASRKFTEPEVVCLDLDPATGRLLTVSNKGDAVKVWAPSGSSGFKLEKNFEKAGKFNYARFAPGGNEILVVNSKAGILQLREIGTTAVKHQFNVGGRREHTTPILSAALSPDGSLLGSGDQSAKLVVWETATGKHKVLEGHKKGIKALAFSPDGSQLLSGDAAGGVSLWTLSAKPVSEPASPPPPAAARAATETQAAPTEPPEPTLEELDDYILLQDQHDLLLRTGTGGVSPNAERWLRQTLAANPNHRNMTRVEGVIEAMRRRVGEVAVVPLGVLQRAARVHPNGSTLYIAAETLHQAPFNLLEQALPIGADLGPLGEREWTSANLREAPELSLPALAPVAAGQTLTDTAIATSGLTETVVEPAAEATVELAPEPLANVTRLVETVAQAVTPTAAKDVEPTAVASAPAPLPPPAPVPAAAPVVPVEVLDLRQLQQQLVFNHRLSRDGVSLRNSIVVSSSKRHRRETNLAYDLSDSKKRVLEASYLSAGSLTQPLLPDAHRRASKGHPPRIVMRFPSGNDERMERSASFMPPGWHKAILSLERLLKVKEEKSKEPEDERRKYLQELTVVCGRLLSLRDQSGRTAPQRLLERLQTEKEVNKLVIPLSVLERDRANILGQVEEAKEKLEFDRWPGKVISQPQLKEILTPVLEKVPDNYRAHSLFRRYVDSLGPEGEVPVGFARVVLTELIALTTVDRTRLSSDLLPPDLREELYHDLFRQILEQRLKEAQAEDWDRILDLARRVFDVEWDAASFLMIADRPQVLSQTEPVSFWRIGALGILFLNPDGTPRRFVPGGGATTIGEGWATTFSNLHMSEWCRPGDTAVFLVPSELTGMPGVSQIMSFYNELLALRLLLGDGVRLLLGTVRPDGTLQTFEPNIREVGLGAWAALLPRIVAPFNVFNDFQEDAQQGAVTPRYGEEEKKPASSSGWGSPGGFKQAASARDVGERLALFEKVQATWDRLLRKQFGEAEGRRVMNELGALFGKEFADIQRRAAHQLVEIAGNRFTDVTLEDDTYQLGYRIALVLAEWVGAGIVGEELPMKQVRIQALDSLAPPAGSLAPLPLFAVPEAVRTAPAAPAVPVVTQLARLSGKALSGEVLPEQTVFTFDPTEEAPALVVRRTATGSSYAFAVARDLVPLAPALGRNYSSAVSLDQAWQWAAYENGNPFMLDLGRLLQSGSGSQQRKFPLTGPRQVFGSRLEKLRAILNAVQKMLERATEPFGQRKDPDGQFKRLAQTAQVDPAQFLPVAKKLEGNVRAEVTAAAAVDRAKKQVKTSAKAGKITVKESKTALALIPRDVPWVRIEIMIRDLSGWLDAQPDDELLEAEYLQGNLDQLLIGLSLVNRLHFERHVESLRIPPGAFYDLLRIIYLRHALELGPTLRGIKQDGIIPPLLDSEVECLARRAEALEHENGTTTLWLQKAQPLDLERQTRSAQPVTTLGVGYVDERGEIRPDGLDAGGGSVIVAMELGGSYSVSRILSRIKNQGKAPKAVVFFYPSTAPSLGEAPADPLLGIEQLNVALETWFYLRRELSLETDIWVGAVARDGRTLFYRFTFDSGEKPWEAWGPVCESVVACNPDYLEVKTAFFGKFKGWGGLDREQLKKEAEGLPAFLEKTLLAASYTPEDTEEILERVRPRHFPLDPPADPQELIRQAYLILMSVGEAITAHIARRDGFLQAVPFELPPAPADPPGGGPAKPSVPLPLPPMPARALEWTPAPPSAPLGEPVDSAKLTRRLKKLVPDVLDGQPQTDQTVVGYEDVDAGRINVYVDISNTAGLEPPLRIPVLGRIPELPLFPDPRQVRPGARSYSAVLDQEKVERALLPVVGDLLSIVPGAAAVDVHFRKSVPLGVLAPKLPGLIAEMQRVLDRPDQQGRGPAERLRRLTESDPARQQRREAAIGAIEGLLEKQAALSERITERQRYYLGRAKEGARIPIGEVTALLRPWLAEMAPWPRTQAGLQLFIDSLPNEDGATDDPAQLAETLEQALQGMRQDNVFSLNARASGAASHEVYYDARREGWLRHLAELQERFGSSDQLLAAGVLWALEQVVLLEREAISTQLILDGAQVPAKTERVDTAQGIGGIGAVIIGADGKMRLAVGASGVRSPLQFTCWYPTSQLVQWVQPGDRRVVLVYPTYTGAPNLDQLTSFLENLFWLRRELERYGLAGAEICMGLADREGNVRAWRPDGLPAPPADLEPWSGLKNAVDQQSDTRYIPVWKTTAAYAMTRAVTPLHKQDIAHQFYTHLRKWLLESEIFDEDSAGAAIELLQKHLKGLGSGLKSAAKQFSPASPAMEIAVAKGLGGALTVLSEQAAAGSLLPLQDFVEVDLAGRPVQASLGGGSGAGGSASDEDDPRAEALARSAAHPNQKLELTFEQARPLALAFLKEQGAGPAAKVKASDFFKWIRRQRQLEAEEQRRQQKEAADAAAAAALRQQEEARQAAERAAESLRQIHDQMAEAHALEQEELAQQEAAWERGWEAHGEALGRQRLLDEAAERERREAEADRQREEAEAALRQAQEAEELRKQAAAARRQERGPMRNLNTRPSRPRSNEQLPTEHPPVPAPMPPEAASVPPRPPDPVPPPPALSTLPDPVPPPVPPPAIPLPVPPPAPAPAGPSEQELRLRAMERAGELMEILQGDDLAAVGPALDEARQIPDGRLPAATQRLLQSALRGAVIGLVDRAADQAGTTVDGLIEAQTLWTPDSVPQLAAVSTNLEEAAALSLEFGVTGSYPERVAAAQAGVALLTRLAQIPAELPAITQFLRDSTTPREALSQQWRDRFANGLIPVVQVFEGQLDWGNLNALEGAIALLREVGVEAPDLEQAVERLRGPAWQQLLLQAEIPQEQIGWAAFNVQWLDYLLARAPEEAKSGLLQVFCERAVSDTAAAYGNFLGPDTRGAAAGYLAASEAHWKRIEAIPPVSVEAELQRRLNVARFQLGAIRLYGEGKVLEGLLTYNDRQDAEAFAQRTRRFLAEHAAVADAEGRVVLETHLRDVVRVFEDKLFGELVEVIEGQLEPEERWNRLVALRPLTDEAVKFLLGSGIYAPQEQQQIRRNHGRLQRDVEEAARKRAISAGARGPARQYTLTRENVLRLTHRHSGRVIQLSFDGEVREAQAGKFTVRLAKLYASLPPGLIAVNGGSLSLGQKHGDWRNSRDLQADIGRHESALNNPANPVSQSFELQAFPGKYDVSHSAWIFGLREFAGGDDPGIIEEPSIVLVPHGEQPLEGQVPFQNLYSDCLIRAEIIPDGFATVKITVEDVMDLYEKPELVSRTGAKAGAEENRVLFLDAGLFDEAGRQKLDELTLAWLGIDLGRAMGHRSLQVVLVTAENLAFLQNRYAGWRIITVRRQEGSDPRPLATGALVAVLRDALLAGEPVFNVIVTQYLDLWNRTMEMELQQLVADTAA